MIRYVESTDGVRLACEVSGAGPPLVMVHGAGSARWSFDLLRPLLEGRFTVVAPDRRGRGGSTDGDGYAVEAEFDDLAAVLRDSGECPWLFGHSYGGLIAAATAARADGLTGLVLYEPPMGGVLAAPDWIDHLEALIRAGERERMATEYLKRVGGYRDGEVDAMRGTPVWEARLAIAPSVIRELRAEHAYRLPSEALGGLAVPTRLLVGSESPEWARRSTEAYAEAIPEATVVRLEGQGHGAGGAAPELVAEEILSFVG